MTPGIFDDFAAALDRAVDECQTTDRRGRVQQVVGTIVRASAPGVRVGELRHLLDSCGCLLPHLTRLAILQCGGARQRLFYNTLKP